MAISIMLPFPQQQQQQHEEWHHPSSISFFFFSSFALSSSSLSLSLVSRELFPMDGSIAWLVQLSDLHFSAYHTERADDMAGLLGPALRAIRPHLLLISGDITDAKNRKRASTRQDEIGWIQYKSTVDSIVRQGGIEKRIIFDIRGNHDKYGVPHVGGSLDFFSSYSISAKLNRLSNIHSISLVGLFGFKEVGGSEEVRSKILFL